MKPLQVGLLVALGAVGGVVWMKMSQPQPQPQPSAVAQAQLPAPTQAPEPAASMPALAPAAPPETKPSPAPVRPAPKPERAARTQAAPATVTVPAPVAAPPAPEPVREIVSTPPPPPARSEPEIVTPPPPPPPPTARVTLNAGTLLPVRLVDGLSTERNMPGDTFTATMDKPLVVDGYVIAERGARVEGRVVSTNPGGRVKGLAALAVELVRLHTADGQTIALQTDSFERKAEQTQKDDVVKVGAGAAIGAAIGAIAGGGKGAAIGAGAGGTAGAGGVLLTRGKAVTLPSETRINFQLSSPVTIVEKR
jgi:hypothetical protein